MPSCRAASDSHARWSVLAFVFALLVLAWFTGEVSAQPNLFGAPQAPRTPPPAAEGITGWLLQKQAEFHRALTQALAAAARGQGAYWFLLGIAFLYGVIHAIGPGHGKAVISSYIIANESILRRGILLAFLAALVQALLALLVVGIVALWLGGTARQVDQLVRIIEQAGFAIIAAMGFWIVWRKIHNWRASGEAAACGHDHAQLPPSGGLGALAMAALGAGIRPCTGAIILLVFALSQQLYLLGLASVLAMAIGTATGTSLFAALAVKAKHWALFLAEGRSQLGRRVTILVEALAGLLLALLGLLLLSGSWSGGN
jgi:ABC-type nickel/cobalt efflux system permease component RcnA